MRSLVIFIGALLLAVLFLPLAFLYSHIRYIARAIRKRNIAHFTRFIDKRYHQIAFGIDQLGNVVCQDVFNDWFIKRDTKLRYDYGKPDHTVSHVTGVNKESLTFFGRLLAGVLNAIDPNHIEKAAKNEQYNGHTK